MWLPWVPPQASLSAGSGVSPKSLLCETDSEQPNATDRGLYEWAGQREVDRITKENCNSSHGRAEHHFVDV